MSLCLPSHLRTETDKVSETSCFLVFRISETPVIPKMFMFKILACTYRMRLIYIHAYTRCSLCRFIRLLSTWCRTAAFFSESVAALSQEVPNDKMNVQSACALKTQYICYLNAWQNAKTIQIKCRPNRFILACNHWATILITGAVEISHFHNSWYEYRLR
jgi:hypothetical protein